MIVSESGLGSGPLLSYAEILGIDLGRLWLSWPLPQLGAALLGITGNYTSL